MTPKQTFLVGARHADGKTSLWRKDAESCEDARALTRISIVQIKPHLRANAVLVCIPGGKE
jgi:hypothetical protein